MTLHSFSQTTNLYGQIIDPNQHPIDFATVQLTTSKSTISKLTDETGQFKFLGISPDSVRIIVNNLGYYQVDSIFRLNNVDSNWITFIQRPSTLIIDTEYVWIGFGAKRAEYDINRNYIRILLPSGLNLHKLPGDEDFEKKYNVLFYNQCQYVDKKSITEYNQVVFKHLDKAFGKQWRKEVRQDLVGLRK